MNIRVSTVSENDRLVDIWLEGSLKAHHFIAPAYWEAQKEDMKKIYLPSSTTFVLERKAENRIVGFISLVDEYIAALFVDIHEQNRGLGTMLLDRAKKERPSLQLKVYQKNDSAVRFYEKNGFLIAGEDVDPATSEKEYVMEWKA